MMVDKWINYKVEMWFGVLSETLGGELVPGDENKNLVVLVLFSAD